MERGARLAQGRSWGQSAVVVSHVSARVLCTVLGSHDQLQAVIAPCVTTRAAAAKRAAAAAALAAASVASAAVKARLSPSVDDASSPHSEHASETRASKQAKHKTESSETSGSWGDWAASMLGSHDANSSNVGQQVAPVGGSIWRVESQTPAAKDDDSS